MLTVYCESSSFISVDPAIEADQEWLDAVDVSSNQWQYLKTRLLLDSSDVCRRVFLTRIKEFSGKFCWMRPYYNCNLSHSRRIKKRRGLNHVNQEVSIQSIGVRTLCSHGGNLPRLQSSPAHAPGSSWTHPANHLPIYFLFFKVICYHFWKHTSL